MSLYDRLCVSYDAFLTHNRIRNTLRIKRNIIVTFKEEERAKYIMFIDVLNTLHVIKPYVLV